MQNYDDTSRIIASSPKKDNLYFNAISHIVVKCALVAFNITFSHPWGILSRKNRKPENEKIVQTYAASLPCTVNLLLPFYILSLTWLFLADVGWVVLRERAERQNMDPRDLHWLRK